MNATQKEHVEKLGLQAIEEIDVQGDESWQVGILAVLARRGRYVTAAFVCDDRPAFYGDQYPTIEAAKAAAVKGRNVTSDWRKCD
jgi:hypothetical protein